MRSPHRSGMLHGICGMFACTLAFAQPPTTPAPAEPAAGISIPDQATEASSPAVAMNDESFGKAAALRNFGDSELSRIALDRSRNLRVKLLADRILKDRSSIVSALQTVARKKNVKLPDKLGLEQQVVVSKLKLQPDEQFDTAYVMQMREENVKAIALFEQAKSSTELSQEMREVAGEGLKILLANQQKTLTIEVPVKAARIVANPM